MRLEFITAEGFSAEFVSDVIGTVIWGMELTFKRVERGRKEESHCDKMGKDSIHILEEEKPADYNVGLDYDNNLGSKKDFGPFTILSLGYVVCNSWIAVAATLIIGISQGGFMTVIYGLLCGFVFMGSSAVSLAELASVYPTAGGQYHWTSILAPEKHSRGLSYVCGSINVFSWIGASAAILLIMTEYVGTLVTVYNPNTRLEGWQYFLIFQFFNLCGLLHNIFASRKSAFLNDIGFVLSLLTFFITMVTCLAMSHPKMSSDMVWTTFVNHTGWDNKGIVFLTGLLNAAFMYSGLDSTIHLAEECTNPKRAIPLALLSTVTVGFITSFVYTVAIAYSIVDIEALSQSQLDIPLYEIWERATNSKAFATTFIGVLMPVTIIGINACVQTSSRLTWSFARDNAIAFSSIFQKVHPHLNVPVYALLLNFFLLFICGCIYLASSTGKFLSPNILSPANFEQFLVFNAVISSAIILQQVNFAFPIATLLYQQRSPTVLPPDRYFNLKAFGWITNILTIITAIMVTLFFNFPVVMPATGSNMSKLSVKKGVKTN